MIETRKKEKIRKSKKLLHKTSSKRWFRSGIHSFLRRADAWGSADIIYHIWRISLLLGSDTVIDVTN